MANILVNGVPVQLLEPVITVNSISIEHHPLMRMGLQKGLGKPVADWLYDLVQRCDGIITYQGVIIEKDSVKEYKGF